MDDFQKMMNKKVRRQMAIIWALCLGIPLLIAGAIYGFLFHVNQFHVDVILNGPEEITLEYGQDYEEPGYRAVFYGTHILKEGVELPVETVGRVFTNVVDTYTVEYAASHEQWGDRKTRTIHVVDTVAPKIILSESKSTYVIPGEAYQEEGFTARDNYDGDITDRVTRTESHGQILYAVEDSSGNRAEVSRDIVYYDPVPPELTLKGDTSITLTVGNQYEEPGYSAMDNVDGDLTAQVKVSGTVNINKAGTYQITYTVVDGYGHSASAVRTVVMKAKPKPKPVIINPTGKTVYLTFDDGPGAYTRELLGILKKYNVKATFFVVNTGSIDIIKEIVADGHAIGIHSVTHSYKQIYASEDAFFDDLYKMQSIIENKTGVKTTLMRFPGGSSNTVSKFNPGIMTRLTQAVEDHGFQYFDWNVSSGDAGGAKTAEKVYQNVISGIQKHNVSIVLQHDIKSYSVKAVEDIIIWGLENGYTFLPLTPNSPTAHHGVNN